MIRTYISNIIRFKKWRLMYFVVLFILVRKFVEILIFRPTVDQFLELDKCPACFGVSACNYVHNVDITLYDVISAFSYFFGVKNVFFGTLDKKKVVLKRLAYSSELYEFDQNICKSTALSYLCTKDNNKENTHDTDFLELIKKEVTLDFTKDSSSRLRLCPTTLHLTDLLQCVYRNNKDVDKRTIDTNIWTLITINPEPLLLQILSSDEGWPVPKYLGACGRVILEEYIGPSLTSYYDTSWFIRAKIVSTLLNAAYMFTFANHNFAFYLTDISADNIAIDSHNVAKFVDLENVIVVDRNISPEEKTANWEQLQENRENHSCSDCLIFSPADICDHKISDHNYYSICKLILAFNINESSMSDGLLHDIPREILHQYTDIQDLIQQCVNPDLSYNRITAGIQLKQLLDTILEEMQ